MRYEWFLGILVLMLVVQPARGQADTAIHEDSSSSFYTIESLPDGRIVLGGMTYGSGAAQGIVKVLGPGGAVEWTSRIGWVVNQLAQNGSEIYVLVQCLDYCEDTGVRGLDNFGIGRIVPGSSLEWLITGDATYLLPQGRAIAYHDDHIFFSVTFEDSLNIGNLSLYEEEASSGLFVLDGNGDITSYEVWPGRLWMNNGNDGVLTTRSAGGLQIAEVDTQLDPLWSVSLPELRPLYGVTPLQQTVIAAALEDEGSPSIVRIDRAGSVLWRTELHTPVSHELMAQVPTLENNVVVLTEREGYENGEAAFVAEIASSGEITRQGCFSRETSWDLVVVEEQWLVVEGGWVYDIAQVPYFDCDEEFFDQWPRRTEPVNTWIGWWAVILMIGIVAITWSQLVATDNPMSLLHGAGEE